MSRLKYVSPRLKALPGRIKSHVDRHGHNTKGQFWRPWYRTARWAGLRLQVFARDNYTCQMSDCRKVTGRPVADHIKPHRGDPSLFWSIENVQTLCKPCHDGRKQAEEHAARFGGQAGEVSAEGIGKMSRPAWFRHVHVPLTIVCGPPGAGKSHYVRERAGPQDLVICFDEIATAKFGRSGPLRPQAALTIGQTADVLRARNEMLGDLMWSKAKDRWSAAWMILSEPNSNHRAWWTKTLGAHVVVIATPLDECIRRMAADASNGDLRGDQAQRYAATWWSEYRPAPGEEVIIP